MDQLESMRAFCKVVATGSFTRAAADLDLGSTVVSRMVAALEDHLQSRLLNRTTRSVSLTEAGRDYFLRCEHILAQLEEADMLATGKAGHASGKLRMLVSFSEGLKLIAPHLTEFRQQYPDVRLDIELNEKAVDIVEEGFDMAIQPEPFVFSSSVVSRSLMRARLVMCAAPDYLLRQGTPLGVADLEKHDCISFSHSELRDHWDLQHETGDIRVRPNNVLVSNNIEILLGAVRTGLGIGLAFEQLISNELKDGRLVRVLPELHAQELNYFIVYPSRKYVPPKVRAMIDFLFSVFAREAGAS